MAIHDNTEEEVEVVEIITATEDTTVLEMEYNKLMFYFYKAHYEDTDPETALVNSNAAKEILDKLVKEEQFDTFINEFFGGIENFRKVNSVLNTPYLEPMTVIFKYWEEHPYAPLPEEVIEEAVAYARKIKEAGYEMNPEKVKEQLQQKEETMQENNTQKDELKESMEKTRERVKDIKDQIDEDLKQNENKTNKKEETMKENKTNNETKETEAKEEDKCGIKCKFAKHKVGIGATILGLAVAGAAAYLYTQQDTIIIE